jgi:hypothetical protein
MNNYIQQINAMLNQGINPQQIAMRLAQGNPAFGRAMQMINGKTPDQIYGMAQQMAQQRGVNLVQVAQQLGVRLPK